MNPQAPTKAPTPQRNKPITRPLCDRVEKANKTAQAVLPTPLLPGLATDDLGDTVTAPSILTPTQRLLLIRSIAGHITPATTTEQAETALARVQQILNGRDPMVGDG